MMTDERRLPGWTEKSPNGRYRRKIRIVAEGDRASADLEDDVHRFGVDLRHQGGVVVEIASRVLRHPYDICPSASARLQEFRDTPLDADITVFGSRIDPLQHCTHQFDLAALAIAQAARGPGRRVYDIMVQPGAEGRHAVVSRDGDEVLNWIVDGVTIRSDNMFDGQDLRTVLRAAREELDAGPDLLEAIHVVRRGLLVSRSRASNPDGFGGPPELVQFMKGACFAFQPENAKGGSVRGNFRDFDSAPDHLLADLADS